MIGNKKPLISVIVPIYKVPELYLRQCVESCINQTMQDIEIILVDDGSPDNCGKICDDYAAKDHRISVIHKENSGVSSARNIGIQKAHGDWILFVDSDDWLVEDACEKLASIAKVTDDDIIGFNNYYNLQDSEWMNRSFAPHVITRKGVNIRWFILDTIFPHYDFKKNGVFVGAIRGVWSKMYRRDLIQEYDITFDPNLKIAEDALFNYDIFAKSKGIALYNEFLIHHRIHDESVMQRYNVQIENINKQILTVFKKRLGIHLQEQDFQIAYTGMLAECVFRLMKLNFLHPLNTQSLLQKIKKFKSIAENEDYGNYIFCLAMLPHGKKEMMYCLKKRWYIGVFIIAWLSLRYLRFKHDI